MENRPTKSEVENYFPSLVSKKPSISKNISTGPSNQSSGLLTNKNIYPQEISPTFQKLKYAYKTKNSFKIKIPYFPKRPFGKHDSMNTSELNFIEMDIKDTSHNLFEKNSKLYKFMCGRATSLGSKRVRSKSVKKQSTTK
ncbi:hypothetical protein SteCoe_12112 [Stentor coeruleus]|uniref:Uncharacterized protein n=1 Tax=Stentor coeruleus TaxID=5963 RepID=A0A1R2CBM6_9CILI|nr:hypothetical protein SteCoe_12112 [Stentor coeruleus]